MERSNSKKISCVFDNKLGNVKHDGILPSIDVPKVTIKSITDSCTKVGEDTELDVEG